MPEKRDEPLNGKIVMRSENLRKKNLGVRVRNWPHALLVVKVAVAVTGVAVAVTGAAAAELAVAVAAAVSVLLL